MTCLTLRADLSSSANLYHDYLSKTQLGISYLISLHT
jgi:hypothetical protein